MYVYVDETGNTGNHIFDKDQPIFVTAAMMTKTNFDVVYAKDIAAIARKVGAEVLHANELGVGRIEIVAPDLLRIVKRAEAKFFLSRVEKLYLAAAKVMDTYFDAGENLAVPWHIYWLKTLKLTITFKLATCVITEEIAAKVWACLISAGEEQSKTFFVEAASEMLENVPQIPDGRTRQVVMDALNWAIENPQNFAVHSRTKILRNTHSPNFVAFSNLLDGMGNQSKTWKKPVWEIVHDRQSQFERTFQHWHDVISRPYLSAIEPVKWPGEKDPIRLGKVPGSKLRMATEETSSGLQVIDVFLWLFRRVLTGKDIGRDGARLLNRAFLRGYQSDFSFGGVEGDVEKRIQEAWDAPYGPEDQARAAEFGTCQR